MHPELDGRTLDIVHCFYNIVLKSRFFCTDQIANSTCVRARARAHVFTGSTFRYTASARASARVVFTGSTFALLIFRRFRCFCNHFRHNFLNLQSHRETNIQMLDNTAISNS